MNRASASASPAAALVPNGGANIDAPKGELTPVTPTKVAPRVAHALLVSSIMQAGVGFKSAIVTEVAACLAVFAQFRGVSGAAKKELFGIYKEAGYQCEVGGNGRDYKTVSRRMNYAGQFYESLKAGTVEEWMGDETHDGAALMAVVNHLTVEFNFRSMNDVLTAAGVAVTTAKPKKLAATPQAPAPQGPKAGGDQGEGLGGQQGPQAGGDKPGPQGGGATPQEPVKAPTATDQKVIDAAKARFAKNEAPTARQAAVLAKYNLNLEADKQPDAGDKGVMDALATAAGERNADQNRREVDSDKWVKVQFAGMTLIVPKDEKRECLADLGVKLMTVANHTKGETIDAVALAEAFKEVAAAH